MCLVDALLQPRDIGDEQIVADELHAVAQRFGQDAPAVPVVLAHAVLDGEDRIGGDQLGVVGGHLLGGEAALLALEEIAALAVELGRRHVEREIDVLARA